MNLHTAQMIFEEAVDNATREAQGRPTVKLLTYVRSTEPVTIECSEHGIIPDVNYNRARRAKEHGTFRVLPSRIITRGQGCPVCRKEDAKVK